MTRSPVRRAAAAVLAAAAFGFVLPMMPAVAVDGVGDIPSVDVQPAHPAKDDPNGGQWFVLSLAPGASGTVQARVSNPANVTQTVTFALRDLLFADDGTPRIANPGPQQDVGSWGGPGRSTFDLPALQTVIVPFTVKVPSDAEPGDHVGAIVALTANRQGKFRVVRQIGARFYITVSGEAVRSFTIQSVSAAKNSGWWPSSVAGTVVLRNTGRTRIRPKVTIGGKKADGSRLLLSRSVEKYTATTKVPWYGGPVNLSVRAVTDDGTVRTSDKSIFVIPWGLIVSVVVGVLLLVGLSKLVRRRVRRVSNLRQDVERLERLVARQAPVTVAADTASDELDAEDEVAALLLAIKRAQRSGSPTSVARLALALHDAGGPAVPALVGVLGKVEGRQHEDVVAALRTSDPVAVAGEVRRSDLSPADREAVLADNVEPPTTARQAPRQRKAPAKAAGKGLEERSGKEAEKAPEKASGKAAEKAAATRRTASKATATAPKPPAPRRGG